MRMANKKKRKSKFDCLSEVVSDVNNEIVRISQIGIDRFERILLSFILCEREGHPKKNHPPSRRTTEPIPLKFGTRIPEVLWYSPMKTEPSRDPPVPGY